MAQTDHLVRRGLLLALLGAMGGGAFVVPWKLASQHGSKESMVLVMVTVAATVNTIFSLAARLWGNRADKAETKRHSAKLHWTLTAVFAVCSIAGNVGSAASVGALSPPLVSVLLRIEVIVIAILAWIFIGERVRPAFWIGCLIAGCGVVLTQRLDDGSSLRLEGVAYGVLAATSFASMNVLTRKYIKRIAPSRLNADRLWLCIPLLLAMKGFQLPSDLSLPLVGYAALAALVGPLGSRLPFMFSAAYLEARYTALVAMSSPVWALLFSWVFLGTWPTRGELFGGLVILAGVSVPLISEVGGLRTFVMRRQRKSSTRV